MLNINYITQVVDSQAKMRSIQSTTFQQKIPTL